MSSYLLLENSPEILILNDASKDPRFAENPFVVNSPHIRFYAGVAIKLDGLKIGAICAMDNQPREYITERQIHTLHVLSEMISDVLYQRRLRMHEIHREQIQYLVGFTNSLKLPIKRSLERFEDVQQYYYTLRNKPPSSPTHHSWCLQFTNYIQQFAQQITAMTNHLEMLLKLAYVSSETKRQASVLMPNTSINRTRPIHKLIFNPILHPNLCNQTLKSTNLTSSIPKKQPNIQTLKYLSMKQLITELQNLLDCQHLNEISLHNNVNDYLHWQYDPEYLHWITLDIELLALILHAILRPYDYITNNDIPNEIQYDLSCSIESIDSSLHLQEYISTPEYLPQQPETTRCPLEHVRMFTLTITPRDLMDTNPDENDMNRYNNSDLDALDDFQYCRLVRKRTLQSLTTSNIVEYSQQRILKDILATSLGTLEMFVRYNTSGSSYNMYSASSKDSFSLNGENSGHNLTLLSSITSMTSMSSLLSPLTPKPSIYLPSNSNQSAPITPKSSYYLSGGLNPLINPMTPLTPSTPTTNPNNVIYKIKLLCLIDPIQCIDDYSI